MMRQQVTCDFSSRTSLAQRHLTRWPYTEFTWGLVQVLVAVKPSPQILALGRILQYFILMAHNTCPEIVQPCEVRWRFRQDYDLDQNPNQPRVNTVTGAM